MFLLDWVIRNQQELPIVFGAIALAGWILVERARISAWTDWLDIPRSDFRRWLTPAPPALALKRATDLAASWTDLHKDLLSHARRSLHAPNALALGEDAAAVSDSAAAAGDGEGVHGRYYLRNTSDALAHAERSLALHKQELDTAIQQANVLAGRAATSRPKQAREILEALEEVFVTARNLSAGQDESLDKLQSTGIEHLLSVHSPGFSWSKARSALKTRHNEFLVGLSQADTSFRQYPWTSSRRLLPLVLGVALVAFGVIATLAELTGHEIFVVDPVAALDLPEFLCQNDQNQVLLLFVHGWRGESADTWKHFPELACEDTFADVMAIDYPTYIWRRNLSIRRLAAWLNETLDERGIHDRYSTVAIIAHSMGGIVARQIIIYKQLDRRAGMKNSFHALVEIATPHKGAALADLARTLGLCRAHVRELAERSPYLEELGDYWERVQPRPRNKCYSSPQDRIVSRDSALSDCEEALEHLQWGHQDLVKPEKRSDLRYALPIGWIRRSVNAG